MSINRAIAVSGTDAAAIVGMSPFKTAADVWIEKKRPDLVKQPTGKHLQRLQWGNYHEPTIAGVYAKKNGVTLYKPPTLAHKTHAWIVGSPDFLVQNVELGLEIKTDDGWKKEEWGPEGTDLIPQHYLLQIMHYLMLTGYPCWDCAVLIGLSDFRVYRVYPDRELIDMLFEEEKKFYTDYLIGNLKPAFDSGMQIKNYVNRRYPRENGTIIDVSPYEDGDLKAKLLELVSVRKLIARAKKTEEELKTFVKGFMGLALQLVWEERGISVKWKKTADQKPVNWKAIATEALENSTLTPEQKAALIKKNTGLKVGPRRFTVKDSSGEDDEDESGPE